MTNKHVTGFSNEEERLAKLGDKVLFLTEDELKYRGVIGVTCVKLRDSFAMEDGRIVIDQNPSPQVPSLIW